jgi:hypothetical protein
MTKSDLGALTNIDRRITGCDRSRYLEQKLIDALDGSDVLPVSILAIASLTRWLRCGTIVCYSRAMISLRRI